MRTWSQKVARQGECIDPATRKEMRLSVPARKLTAGENKGQRMNIGYILFHIVFLLLFVTLLCQNVRSRSQRPEEIRMSALSRCFEESPHE